jgi:hypothetical protein
VTGGEHVAGQLVGRDPRLESSWKTHRPIHSQDRTEERRRPRSSASSPPKDADRPGAPMAYIRHSGFREQRRATPLREKHEPSAMSDRVGGRASSVRPLPRSSLS